MAKKKNYWYVVVLTNDGAKFVTSLDYSTKYATWDKSGKPKELGESVAKDISFGLLMNFYHAYAVCIPFELESQPYRYNDGHFEWVENSDEEV